MFRKYQRIALLGMATLLLGLLVTSEAQAQRFGISVGRGGNGGTSKTSSDENSCSRSPVANANSPTAALRANSRPRNPSSSRPSGPSPPSALRNNSAKPRSRYLTVTWAFGRRRFHSLTVDRLIDNGEAVRIGIMRAATPAKVNPPHHWIGTCLRLRSPTPCFRSPP